MTTPDLSVLLIMFLSGALSWPLAEGLVRQAQRVARRRRGRAYEVVGQSNFRR